MLYVYAYENSLPRQTGSHRLTCVRRFFFQHRLACLVYYYSYNYNFYYDSYALCCPILVVKVSLNTIYLIWPSKKFFVLLVALLLFRKIKIFLIIFFYFKIFI